MNEFVLFNISGGIGTALFMLLYAGMLAVYPPAWPSPSTVVWAGSYSASIFIQHALHRFIVFGAGDPYWPSLVKTLAIYSLSLVLSTVLNYVLSEALHVSASLAFGAGLASTGVLNYYASKAWAFQRPAPKAD